MNEAECHACGKRLSRGSVCDDCREEDDEGENESGWSQFPHETVTAVEPNEVTAGVDVTVYGLDDVDHPMMLEISENYPPEDGVEGESVCLHGPHAMLQLLATVADLYSGQYDSIPWDTERDGGDADR